MRTFKLGTAIAGALLVLGVTSAGCVADRPARNGVFNENQYVRKDFLIQGVDPNGAGAVSGDPGWIMRSAVTEISSPNLLGNGFSVWSGLTGAVNLVRFRVTSDKLQMLSMLSYSSPVDSVGNNGTVATNLTGTTENVLNAWPATNVDLKYQVNLDGETTNFYQENQELDWQVRQWVKLSFDKNDMSDLAPLGQFTTEAIATCADLGDASATLVDGSFNIEGADDDDITNDYMEFTVNLTIPMLLNNADCATMYGSEATAASRIGGEDIRSNVTLNLKYSMKRATPVADLTYKPWIMPEKDPIHHKYGPFLYTSYAYDEATNLVAANQYVGRFDPTKPIVWYFDRNFPETYKGYFRNLADPKDLTTIQGATNKLLDIAGAANPKGGTNPGTTAQVSFLEYNDGGIERNYGDIRYNFLRWTSDEFIQTGGLLGVTMPGFDPRTGEIVNEAIMYNDYPMLDIIQRIDAFLVSVGASEGLGCGPNSNPGGLPSTACTTSAWSNPTINGTASATCKVGETVPILTTSEISNHNANSTLFQKMQQYLNLNAPIVGDPASGTDPLANHLGPQDFVNLQNANDSDFLNAYIALLPYEVFQDPAANAFVTPEGGNGVFGPAQMLADVHNQTLFNQAAATIDSGATPFTQAAGVGGVANAVGFANQMRNVTNGVMNARMDNYYAHPEYRLDSVGTFAFETAMARDARMCVCNGTDTAALGSTSGYGTCAAGSPGVWETKDQWSTRIINRSWAQVMWHEFGHSLGMEHNFEGSIDQPNFTAQRDGNGNVLCDDGSTGTKTTCNTGHTIYNMLTSTVMEYNSSPQDYNWVPGWGTFDQASIAFLYSNTSGPQADDTTMDKTVPATSLSGQASATYPYNDPLGFCAAGSNDCTAVGPEINGSYERRFLRCDNSYEKYTPFCREFDLGVTPSEIIANEIDAYEWQYTWRNFRTYHKVWDLSGYAGGVTSTITDMRRFYSPWAFDWAGGSLESLFLRIGVTPPVGSDGGAMMGGGGNGSLGYSQIDYYNQLLEKFETEMSKTGQMVAAFDEAIIQQASGERPFATVYDKFYGDVTQQGIILDKYFAMQSFVGLWQSDNYDVNDSGAYLSSWGTFDGDGSYQTVAETAVTSMIGTQYAGYPYFIPTAVALFAQDSHSPSFIGGGGRVEAKDWIGGWTFGGTSDVDPYEGLRGFFRNLAVASCQTQSSTCIPGCETSAEACTYDPTDPTQVAQSPETGQFTGPDTLQYIYAYIPSRNEIVLAREDRNITMWKLINNLNTDLIGNKDDGSGGAYSLLYPIEYTIDSYEAFEQASLTNDQQSSVGSGS